MKHIIIAIIAIAAMGCGVYGSYFESVEPSSKVDYPGFTKVTAEVDEYRKKRLISSRAFAQKALQKDVIVLDTRSKSAYDRIHVKGAVHLNFSDFTKASLAKMIPNKNTTILIYCNNNVDTPNPALMNKGAPLALNIPTFINLYGYGYKNVYELKDMITLKDPYITFEGTDVKSTVVKKTTNRHQEARAQTLMKLY